MNHSQPVRDLLSLGFSSLIAQVVLVRQAMMTLGGTEIAWGLVLSLWLMGIALGSRLGIHYGSSRMARRLPLLILVLAGIGTIIFRAAPVLIGAAAGEITGTIPTLWLSILAIMPGAVAGGFCFPIFAQSLDDSGRAYSWEATGALLGGLFFTGLTASLGAMTTLMYSAIVVLMLSTLRPLVVAVLALVLISVSPTIEDKLSQHSWLWSQRPGELGIAAETQQQRIDVSKSAPTTVYANGRLIASYPDSFLTVPRTHLLMLLHPDPHRVLATNSLADGSLITMLRHPINEFYVVEEDPAVPELLLRCYDDDFKIAFADPRIRLLTTDPIRAIDSVSDIDLIINFGSLPSTIRLNRLWTKEYFEACRDHLGSGGVLVLGLGISDTYLGGGSGKLFDVIASTLQDVFREVRAIPGEQIVLVASDHDINFDDLKHRFTERGIVDSQFVPEMINLFLDQDRIDKLETRLKSTAQETNSLMHPRAVLLAGGLAEGATAKTMLTLAMELHSMRPTLPLVLLVSAIFACLLLCFSRTPIPVSSVAATLVGAGSLTWWLLLLAIWQSVRGSAYAEIGGLTALFMAGLALGSRRKCQRDRDLPLILLASAALSLMTMTGVPAWNSFITVPLLLVVGGLLTGVAFPCLAAAMKLKSVRASSGIVFAADEIGAALAAGFVGLLAIPWIGIAATAGGLAALQLAIIPAILIFSRRTAQKSGSST